MSENFYKAVIFDLDGTLVNSLQDLADSTNYALKTMGCPTYETDRYRFFVGRGVAKLIEAVLPEPERSEQNMRRARALFDEYYNLHYLDNTRPYPGIEELLGKLKAYGLRLAVVSNKPHAFVQKLVGSLFGGSFDVVFGQRDGVPRKPDPAGPLEACSVMGAEPAQCLYLGDSGVDMLTASAAGMAAVGVTWGFRSEQELLENGAKKLISGPAELLELLQKPV